MKSIQGARVNSQTQGVGGPEHSSVLAKGFPSEREICRNLRHNNGYKSRILYIMSELSIHPLTRVPTASPSAGDVSRGFTKGSIRVPEGAFCVKLWRSVPLVSTTCDSVLPFHGADAGSNPAGDAKSIHYRRNTTLCLTRDWKSQCFLTFFEMADYEFSPKPPCCLGRVELCAGCGPGLENRVGVYLSWSAGSALRGRPWRISGERPRGQMSKQNLHIVCAVCPYCDGENVISRVRVGHGTSRSEPLGGAGRSSVFLYAAPGSRLKRLRIRSLLSARVKRLRQYLQAISRSVESSSLRVASPARSASSTFPHSSLSSFSSANSAVQQGFWGAVFQPLHNE